MGHVPAAWLIAASALAASPVGDTTADSVTLRDKTVVLGVIAEQGPRGVLLYVRREWARENVPKAAERWERAERTATIRAAAQRRERLLAWKGDRASAPAAGRDLISPWIDRELDRLKAGPTASTLMAVKLGPGEAHTIAHAPKGSGGLLKQAWVAAFKNPETLGADDLREALKGRGYDPSSGADVPLDRLLPLAAETDLAWLTRRAATEVAHDPGLRFVRHQGIVLPDTSREGAAGALQIADALPGIAALLTGETAADPLQSRLKAVAASGRVGAMVTSQDVSPDFSGVKVEATLWVRTGGDRWTPAGSRSATVNPAELGQGAGKELEADPQVAQVFRLFEGVLMKEVPQGFKNKALGVGAATRKALGIVASGAEADLSRLAFPVLDAEGEAPAPKAQGDRR